MHRKALLSPADPAGDGGKFDGGFCSGDEGPHGSARVRAARVSVAVALAVRGVHRVGASIALAPVLRVVGGSVAQAKRRRRCRVNVQ